MELFLDFKFIFNNLGNLVITIKNKRNKKNEIIY